jgi:hypothetical protein
MYTHLLASVFDDWVDELTGSALVDYTLVCRDEMLASALHRPGSASMALAAEVSYDRALIKLCVANGVEVNALGFSHPAVERERLEHGLMAAGVDLAVLARRRFP